MKKALVFLEKLLGALSVAGIGLLVLLGAAMAGLQLAGLLLGWGQMMAAAPTLLLRPATVAAAGTSVLCFLWQYVTAALRRL